MITSYEMKTLFKTHVLVPKTPIKTVHRMIKINHTGVFLFSKLSEGMDLDTLISLYQDHYGLSFHQAQLDCMNFIKTLVKEGIMDAPL